MIRKIVLYIALSLTLITVGYFSFIYYVPYSDGVRSGELIKISHKGFVVKTWEGELSQGISGAQIFAFSIMGNETAIIEVLGSGEYLTIKTIEKKVSLKISKETIRKIVNKLVTDGEIECEKIGRENSYRKIG